MSDQQKTREATLAIADAVVARDGNLDGFSDPELADLVNGFADGRTSRRRVKRRLPSPARWLPATAISTDFRIQSWPIW
ncbi:hypothetical protein AJ88_46945 [Mesorhizobium amorphae CCBAU 01583]|nr:hypothetical protein AJ88_46945 [Mesorhizobium amorphae CCBAU 01583]